MQTETYRGTVRRVFFSNPESPFMAGVLELDEEGAKTLGIREIRFGGKCCAASGDKLEVTGVWSDHPKYGRQFQAESGMVRMDESPEALIHLLATDDRFKGLGPARARKVVEAALSLSTDGEMASALIEYSAEVSERAHVPLDIVQHAAEVWKERRTYFDSLARLAGQGWSNAQAQKILHRFGIGAERLVADNPYMLIKAIPRFGFRTVDAVARKMGVRSTDPGRMLAGVAYCLDEMGGNGNTWTTRAGLIDAAIKELRPDTLQGEECVAAALDELIVQGHVYVDKSPLDTEIVSDAMMATAEVRVFERLIAGLQTELPVQGLNGSDEGVSLTGARAQAILPTLNEGQTSAVWGTWRHRFSVISGGAGVGKTYTMRAICEIAEENGIQVALCAPTGKAARKLAQSTGREAMTIHRLLQPKMDEETGRFVFRRNVDNRLDELLVVVDEVSMVDVRLMRSLLEALRDDARLLMVGDHHQIPSVSPGAILRDVLAGRKGYPDSVHILTEIVRQAGDLARNTSAILDGVVTPTTGEVWRIHHTEKGHEEGAAGIVAMIVEGLLTAEEPLSPYGRALDFAWDVQVLTPMKKGPLGTAALNARLQALRQRLLGNPPPEPLKDDERPKPLVGDRIIWTKNDYELNLNNGTQAIVLALRKGGAMDILTEDGIEVTIPPEKRVNVDVAFAMTIHKSQGSQWPCVVLVGSSSHWIMHDRNLLYTGASRAAQGLTIVGDKQGLSHFAREQRSVARQTLGSFLVHGWRPSVPFTDELTGLSKPGGYAVENEGDSLVDEIVV